MLKIEKILYQAENNIDAIIEQKTTLGQDLWKILLEQHPADIAMLLGRIDEEQQVAFFKKLPVEIAGYVFRKLSESTQAELLVSVSNNRAEDLLKNMPADELTDLFDHLSDDDLEKYLKLLQIKKRSQILSLLNFDPHSAGGRMNSDTITLQKEFTVKKSIELLQRIGSKIRLQRHMYVTDDNNVLVGYITIEQLVLSKPGTPLAEITKQNILTVGVDEDQEEVVYQMRHYGLLSVPVTDQRGHFLGVITADDIFDIIEEEESEDMYKRFGLVPSEEYGYFATPVSSVIWQRGIWLVSLLILQSVSSMIISQYEALMSEFAIIAIFMTMLTGTGGNAGNQSATVVIRGLITKEVTRHNAWRVLLRELGVSVIMAAILSSVGFMRVYWAKGDLVGAFAINTALFLIIITSMSLGALIPIVLERLDIDPAHSAAPFLATLMDVLGVLILFLVCSQLLI